MKKEYTFSKIKTEDVTVDFERLLEDIVSDNPELDENDIYDEFGNNAGYYLNMQLGYDPYDVFYECDDIIEEIWRDFGVYLEQNV